ncbi:conserved hypothetical protein [Candidatus Sulfobium mesophilum]|uniref:GspL periplasmic domain-containing protein n=1 Tax=Candidatus Sulfobium mesophilum TaxID=2016548 RepID=A0A2U3QID4_9BACT|nr:conserved hypothetical protein [Candidatus Sulfobium mesophilum]
MGKKVFLDLKGRDLLVYTFDNGSSGSLPKGTVTIPVEESSPFAIDRSLGSEECYFSLPLSLLDFRILELPFSDIKKIRELLPFEIDNLVLGGSASVVFDACVIDKDEGKAQVLVVYIAKGTLKTILNKLRAAGVDPRVVISLELAHVVSSSASASDIAGRLLSPGLLDDNERILTAAAEIKNPTVNLRRGEFAYTADTEKTRKSLLLTAGLVILLLFVFISDNVMLIVSTKRENDSIKESIRKTYQGLFPAEKKITDELYQLKAHIKELKDKESSFVGISPLQTLLDLSNAGRSGVSFIEVTVDRDITILKGEAPSMSDVQKTKTELEKIFSEVNISDTKPSTQGKMLFSISVKGRKT